MFHHHFLVQTLNRMKHLRIHCSAPLLVLPLINDWQDHYLLVFVKWSMEYYTRHLSIWLKVFTIKSPSRSFQVPALTWVHVPSVHKLFIQAAQYTAHISCTILFLRSFRSFYLHLLEAHILSWIYKYIIVTKARLYIAYAVYQLYVAILIFYLLKI